MPASGIRGPKPATPRRAVPSVLTERSQNVAYDKENRNAGPAARQMSKAGFGIAEGSDEYSPRFGDHARQPHSKLTFKTRVNNESSDDDDLHTLKYDLQQANSRNRVLSGLQNNDNRARSEDDVSFSNMSSPAKVPSRSAILTHDSPVSGFENMARELRREFERITGAATNTAQPTPSARVAFQSPTRSVTSDIQQAGRGVFGDAQNVKAATPTDRSRKNRSLYSSIHSGHESANDNDDYADPGTPTANRSTPRSRHQYILPDITGLTEGLASPEKAYQHPRLITPNRSQTLRSRDVVYDNRPSSDLKALEHQLQELEAENAKSAKRANELKAELVSRKKESNNKREDPYNPVAYGPQDAYDAADSGLETLVERLHTHVARLTKSLSTHADALDTLKDQSAPRNDVDHLRAQMGNHQDQIDILRQSIEALSREVDEVRQLVEGLLAQRNLSPPALRQSQSLPHRSEGLANQLAEERAQLRQSGKPMSAPTNAGSYLRMPAPIRPASAPVFESEQPRPKHNQIYQRPIPVATDGLDKELQRAEAILRSVPDVHDRYTCRVCKSRLDVPADTRQPKANTYQEPDQAGDVSMLPPQTTIARALRELEEDFASHKRIYVELSEAYRQVDPASNATKRRALACHLKESIEVLESKADEIKRLYDLLHYRETENPRDILAKH